MLIADRFFGARGAVIDLASGDRVDLRTLPAITPSAHLDWLERCARDANRCDTGGGPRLLDFGPLDADTRFEAYAATERDAADTRRERAADAHAIKQVEDVLATARLGEPRWLHLWANEPPPPGTLDDIARLARLHGFVPVSAELAAAERGPAAAPCPAQRGGDRPRSVLARVLAGRHVLLIARKPVACARPAGCVRCAGGRPVICPQELARLVANIGALNCRPTVLIAAKAPRTRCVSADLDGSAAGPGEPAPRKAAEAHEHYVVALQPDVTELRARGLATLRQPERGPQRIEVGLREAAGALSRRHDLAGAACLTLNLGCLFLDRGRALDAARAFDDARRQFDAARDTLGVIRATVYLGLAWTDEARFAEAGAALRAARIAAEESGSTELDREARLGVARCLYWEGRFDEAYVLVAGLLDGHARETPCGVAPAPAPRGAAYASPAEHLATSRASEAHPMQAWWNASGPVPLARLSIMPADPDGRVRALALAVRLALADGDICRAMDLATAAGSIADETGRAVDACVGRTAQASVHASLKDVTGLLAHVRAGLVAARLAHAPLRGLRLRMLAVDGMRQAGHSADARRGLQRLSALHRDRFPALLRARLDIVSDTSRPHHAGGTGLRPDRHHQLTIAACPWRPVARAADLVDDVVGILHACHELPDEEAGLQHLCDLARERLGALVVALVAREPGQAHAVISRSGCALGQTALAERVADTGLPVTGPTPLGLESASPVRYAATTVGAVIARWPCDALIDTKRATGVLTAVAAAAAPHVRSWLDRRNGPPTATQPGASDLLGESAILETLRRAVRRAASAPFPVLIEGESGSGKELVARAIHRDSPRRLRRFSALNCAALTDDLLEAELFGHARGAFTGAVADRVGLFEEADGGTLFLDEVADLSARAQAKLLRVLQEGEVRRVGENIARTVDVRVVAATNRELEREVEAGAFRRDLFYRLHVVHIAVPPLRQRAEDIPLLAMYFWQAAATRTGSRATLSPATLAALARYDWPGNVRELQNVMAALAVSAPQRGSIAPGCLPPVIARSEVTATTLEAARQSFERSFVRAALVRAAGHRGRAAASLGVSRQGLAKLMSRLGIDLPTSADST